MFARLAYDVLMSTYEWYEDMCMCVYAQLHAMQSSLGEKYQIMLTHNIFVGISTMGDLNLRWTQRIVVEWAGCPTTQVSALLQISSVMDSHLLKLLTPAATAKHKNGHNTNSYIRMFLIVMYIYRLPITHMLEMAAALPMDAISVSEYTRLHPKCLLFIVSGTLQIILIIQWHCTALPVKVRLYFDWIITVYFVCGFCIEGYHILYHW